MCVVLLGPVLAYHDKAVPDHATHRERSSIQFDRDGAADGIFIPWRKNPPWFFALIVEGTETLPKKGTKP
jgi:hypothetical protein